MNLIDSSEADINCALVQKMLSTPEMPSALVVGTPSFSSWRFPLINRTGEDRQEFFDDLTEKISQSTELLSSKLAPEHFSNLQVALKTLIEGFIGTDDESSQISYTFWCFFSQQACRKAKAINVLGHIRYPTAP
jgi:hypothetical protein